MKETATALRTRVHSCGELLMERALEKVVHALGLPSAWTLPNPGSTGYPQKAATLLPPPRRGSACGSWAAYLAAPLSDTAAVRPCRRRGSPFRGSPARSHRAASCCAGPANTGWRPLVYVGYIKAQGERELAVLLEERVVV